MKTYLVTGGAGFIGSNYILFMLQKYHDIHIINLDALTYAGSIENLRAAEGSPQYTFVHGNVCDRSLLDRLFRTYSIDRVIHFAAESHVDRSISDPTIFAQTNVIGTLTLLNAARAAWEIRDGEYRSGVKFVQISTDEVYGSLGETGYFTETSPIDPHSPYAASKASAQLFVKACADTYRLPMNITCCSNNYGPFQFPEKLIPLTILRCLQHRKIPVYGDGMQVRDWIYVEDHCKAIDLVTQKGRPGEVYHVGGHNERTNIDLIKSVIACIRETADAAVSEELIEYVADRKGHDRRYGIDPSKIRRDLGWIPETSFDEGLSRTVKWYLDNRSWLLHAAGEIC